jgi:hypothetical protein
MRIHKAISYPVLLVSLFTILPLAAQTGSGVLQGTFFDVSKAAVPNARAALTNTDTGVVRSAISNQAGVYYFGAVPPGPYLLSGEASGFRKWEGKFAVEVGQILTIDPVFELGSVGATVDVSGTAPIISTEGMQISDFKDSLRIHQLPLNGRAVTNLFDLTAGVEGGGNPRVNGLKVGSTDMLLDGTSLVNRFGGGVVQVQPGLDTIQEFRIETAGSNAQYSRPATVTLVTKSGTNQLHGSLFETHRNNFGGLRARQRQDADVLPKLIRNEFGASAGGRIVKNKTFWFGSYEGLRQNQASFARTSAPTDAMWNGDLSNAVTTNGEPITIYNPFSTRADGTRDRFPNNQIPKNLIASYAAVMRGVSAVPSGPNAAANPWVTSNFQTYYPQTNNTNTWTAKFDHIFSEKDTISGRFTRSWLDNQTTGGVYGYPPPGATNAGGTSLQATKTFSAFARWNHMFRPSLLNELQVSSDRSINHAGTLADTTNWATKLGYGNPFGALGWPTICLGGGDPFYDGCWDAGNPSDQNLTGFQIEDHATWIKGSHVLKFGIKGRQELNNVRELQQAQGSHSFGSDWTAQYDPISRNAISRTGSGFAGMLMGLPTNLSNQYNRGYFYFRQKEFGPYIQDSWKVTRRLTIDLGVRWDKWTVYHEKYNRLLNLDLQNFAGKMEVITPGNTKLNNLPGIPPAVLASWAARGLTSKSADEAGFPSGLLPANNFNFAPRIGAAFRLTDRWVIRAGYGMYYWTMPLSQILQSSRTNPPLNLRFQNQISTQQGADFVYALSHSPASTDMLGQATVDTQGIVKISTAAQPFMPWNTKSWSDTRAQEWTVTFERELMKNTSLRLSYIGNHGSNIEQRWRWNDPESAYNYQARTGLQASTNPDLRRVNPNWTSGCCNAPIYHNGYSNNHSVQAEVNRHYSNGLAFQAFYTFSHAMTTNDTGGYNFGSSGVNSSGSGSAFAVPEAGLLWGEPSLTESQRLRLGYANSDSVPAQRVRWNGIYDLPFGKGRKFGNGARGFTELLIGGWQIAFIGDLRSGLWMGIGSNLWMFGNPTLDASQRLDMNIFGKNQRLWFRGYFDPNQATAVDAAALQKLVPPDPGQRIARPLGPNFDNRLPQTLANGTVVQTSITDMVNWNARNFFRGPRSWNQDASLFKNIGITERVKLRFTADFFNAFNHPVDVAPNGTTGLQDLSVQSNSPRIIQLSLRLTW